MVHRDKNRRQIKERRCDESHPLLKAVLPAAAVDEQQHGHSVQALVGGQEDVDLLIVVFAVRHIEKGPLVVTTLRERASARSTKS